MLYSPACLDRQECSRGLRMRAHRALPFTHRSRVRRVWHVRAREASACVCVCVRVCVCTCVCACVCVCTCARVRAWMDRWRDGWMHACVYVHTYACVRARACVYMRACMNACACVCVRACVIGEACLECAAEVRAHSVDELRRVGRDKQLRCRRRRPERLSHTRHHRVERRAGPPAPA